MQGIVYKYIYYYCLLVLHNVIHADLLRSLHVAVSPTLCFLNLGCLLSSALMNCATLLYQLFPTIVKQSVKQLSSDLMQTLCFGSCFLHRLLFLISPLKHPVQWLILFGKLIMPVLCMHNTIITRVHPNCGSFQNAIIG